MRFEFRFAFQDQIECAIEPVFVDLLIGKLQEIAERRSPIPIFRDVEFA